MSLPLEGIRVVEVAEQSFVPSAGAVLADWGADVVKVERPTGDPLRAVVTSGLVASTGDFDYLSEQMNRSKRGVCLDLRSEGGRAALDRLVAGADVFLTNFLPSVCRKLRIEPADLQAEHPRLVYARGHGQGIRGDEADVGGYDAVSFFSRGGIAHMLTAQGADELVRQRPALGDVTVGMYLAGGICAALLRRERTGEGAVVDCSLLAGALWTLAPDLVAASVLGAEPERIDPMQIPNPLIGTFRTADDRWLMLTMLDLAAWWPTVCAVLGLDELAALTVAEVAERTGELRERIGEVLATDDLPVWERRFGARDCIVARVSDPVDVLHDPQVQANGYLPPHPTVAGARLVANPVQFDGEPTVVRRPAPARGAHTDEVLLEAGVGPDELAAWHAAGALGD